MKYNFFLNKIPSSFFIFFISLSYIQALFEIKVEDKNLKLRLYLQFSTSGDYFSKYSNYITPLTQIL